MERGGEASKEAEKLAKNYPKNMAKTHTNRQTADDVQHINSALAIDWRWRWIHHDLLHCGNLIMIMMMVTGQKTLLLLLLLRCLRRVV